MTRHTVVTLCVLFGMSLGLSGCSKTKWLPQSTVFLTPDDTPGDLIYKAISVVPTDRQWQWQRDEFSCFIHFGINTFTGREWGTGTEDPRLFNPVELNTDQWCEHIKAAGMSRVIFTAKHHDGFCLWPTRYTDHSVASSPWQDGNGDVLRELVTSCHKYGLNVGVYLSPADLYQIEAQEGLYGNQSGYTERVIPRPVPGRPFKDKRTFRFVCDDYNEYFLNQLFELLTEYGPIHEVWFDGAHPKRKGGQVYTYQQWYELIRTLAPEAVIFGKGPDVRWCGNEAGATRDAEWSVIPIAEEPNEFDWPDMTANDLGSLNQINARLGKDGALHWYPAETNTSIRDGWFWRDATQHVKSAQDILDIWYRAVGGNTVFLLNVPPNRRGLFSERDCEVLKTVGKTIKQTFSHNLAQDVKVECSNRRSKDFAAKYAVDGDLSTCWMPDEGETLAYLTIKFKKKKTFNRIVIQEHIRQFSQRIEGFSVDAQVGNHWRTIAQGQTVGYKRICRTEPVTTDQLRIRILKSRVCPTLSEIGVYWESVN